MDKPVPEYHTFLDVAEVSNYSGGRFGLLLFNSTFSTNRLYRATEEQCISCRAGEQHNHTIAQ